MSVGTNILPVPTLRVKPLFSQTSPALKPLKMRLILHFHTAGLGKSLLSFPLNIHWGGEGRERGFIFVLLVTIDTCQSNS